MREPSIHITLGSLQRVLKELDMPDMALEILEKAKKYTVNNRNVILDKVYAEKKLTKESLADNAVYKEVYKYYSMLTRQKYSYTPKRYKVKDTRLLGTIASVTSDILDFAEVNNIDSFNEATKLYLEIGLRRTKKLQSIAGNSENIQEIYLAEKELGNDKKDAMELHKIYSLYMVKYTGQEYELNSETILLKFKKAASWCKAKGIDYEDFIEALFVGLEWKSGIPSPSMFSSDYGIQLVYEYLGNRTQKSNNGFTSINLTTLTDD